MFRIIAIGVVIIATAWVASVAFSRTAIQRLVLTGSSTVAPLASEIAKRYELLHPDVRIDVQTGGSSRGIADVRRGMADIGMASRSLKKSETDIVAHQIARDGVCVIIHADNPLRSLTDQQVIDIYTDKIHNWKELGGTDAPIVVVNKAEGRATLEVFLKYFGLENPSIQADVVIGDNEQGIKTVSGNVHSIAYVSVGTAEYDAEHGQPIRLLASKGVAASTKTLATGTFPISRPLNLLTLAQTTGDQKLINDFIEYCQSPAVADIVKAQCFVPTSH